MARPFPVVIGGGPVDETPDDFVALVQHELAKRNWSQRRLADETLLGEATIARLLKGKFSRKTKWKVQKALGLTSATAIFDPQQIAKPCYGGYVLAHHDHYVGQYLSVRPSFTDDASLSVAKISIEWSPSAQALMFCESTGQHEHVGTILMPPGVPYFHFLTQDQAGSARMITAYHTYKPHLPIRGILLTCAALSPNVLHPATAPVVMRQINNETKHWAGLVGLQRCDAPDLAAFVDDLDKTRMQAAALV